MRFNSVSQNKMMFKEFKGFLMNFVDSYMFAQYSMGKKRLRLSQRQYNHSKYEFQRFVLSLIDLRSEKSACGQPQAQQKRHKYMAFDTF